MAVLMELHYDKEEILESYLNEVYLGQDGPAGNTRFCPGGAALLRPAPGGARAASAGAAGRHDPGPSLYNPRRNPERARERRDLVLRVMAEPA
jgi:penicillin-binding protein 1B